MADWDANSPRLTENLAGVLRQARAAAFRRDALSLEDARVWHRSMMAGLRVPPPSHVGRFRGETGLETYRVRVGVNKGVAPDDVGGALARFEQTLQSAVTRKLLVKLGVQPANVEEARSTTSHGAILTLMGQSP